MRYAMQRLERGMRCGCAYFTKTSLRKNADRNAKEGTAESWVGRTKNNYAVRKAEIRAQDAMRMRVLHAKERKSQSCRNAKRDTRRYSKRIKMRSNA
jgi:cytochrome c biogenesis factor